MPGIKQSATLLCKSVKFKTTNFGIYFATVKSDEPFIRYIKISGSSLRWRLGGFLRGEGAYMQYVTEAEKKPNEVYAQDTPR